MKVMCKQGYKDGLDFIRRNGLLQFRLPVQGPSLLSEEEEEEEGGMKGERSMVATSSSMEDHIFEHLPPRLHQALVEACRERRSLFSSMSNLLPVRLASAMMLPYTLPLESAVSFTVRLLEWLPDVPEDIEWMKQQSLNVLHYLLRGAKKSLSHHLSARLSYHLELHRSQSLLLPVGSGGSSELLQGWVRNNTSVMGLILKVEEYQRQLLPGMLCINLDMQASLSHERVEMRPLRPSLSQDTAVAALPTGTA
ncbi:UNVERIFIED_CONTAM: hypothetical protein FKN15_021140 [Acipenser sinensis]